MPPIPDSAEIRAILETRIEDQEQGVGIVVGIVEPAGRRIVCYGQFSKNDPRPVDGDTVFEIGSVTKVFTSLLLADMVTKRAVNLSDPIAKYLPMEISVPQYDGTEIALVDLATHTSGLPGTPDNISSDVPGNPFAGYSVDQLYEFLSRHRLAGEIGVNVEYSNLGYGLLAHILARSADAEYEDVICNRIAEPLGMSSTAITLNPALMARLAPGHNPAFETVPSWDFSIFAGAGAFRSTANDLMNFLEAALGYRISPLDAAFAEMLAVRRPAGTDGGEVALGWGISHSGEDEKIGHAGRTGGYCSFIGYHPKTRTGVVVLSNMAATNGVGDLGAHLLDPKSPLAPPPKQRAAVAIDPEIYEGYIGRFQPAPDFVVTVTREGDRLFVENTGNAKLEIFPESDTEFFFRDVDAQITFERDENGRASSLTLHQGNQNTPAPRID